MVPKKVAQSQRVGMEMDQDEGRKSCARLDDDDHEPLEPHAHQHDRCDQMNSMTGLVRMRLNHSRLRAGRCCRRSATSRPARTGPVMRCHMAACS